MQKPSEVNVTSIPSILHRRITDRIILSMRIQEGQKSIGFLKALWGGKDEEQKKTGRVKT